MIILYVVPISLWPILGKENRYFYTSHSNNNDRWFFFISKTFKLLSLILIILETPQTVVHQEYQSSGTCPLTVNTLVTYFSMTNLTVTICQVTVFWKTNFLMWMMFLKKRLRPVELDVNKWRLKNIFLYSFFILHNHMISGELNVNCKILIFTSAAF